jgi:hypothetical protein
MLIVHLYAIPAVKVTSISYLGFGNLQFTTLFSNSAQAYNNNVLSRFHRLSTLIAGGYSQYHFHLLPPAAIFIFIVRVPLLPDFVFGEVFLQPQFVVLVLQIIQRALMAKRFFSAQERARKDPPYFGTAFGASCQRFIIYPLPDLELVLTQLAVSTVS